MEGEFSLTVQNFIKRKLGGEGRPRACSVFKKKAICAQCNGNIFQLQLSCAEV